MLLFDVIIIEFILLCYYYWMLLLLYYYTHLLLYIIMLSYDVIIIEFILLLMNGYDYYWMYIQFEQPRCTHLLPPTTDISKEKCNFFLSTRLALHTFCYYLLKKNYIFLFNYSVFPIYKISATHILLLPTTE